MGLFGNKAPTAKFNKLGDEVEGEIVAFDQQQRTEYLRGGGMGAPMFWHGGRPVAGVAADPQTGEPNRPVMDDVIVLDTGVADEFGETERRLFIKGKQQRDALKAACREAGLRDVSEGDRLRCRWASGAGGTADPREYAFVVTPAGCTAPVKATAAVPAGGDSLQETLARKTASAQAAAERLTKTPAAKPALSKTKAALGIPDDDEPPF